MSILRLYLDEVPPDCKRFPKFVQTILFDSSFKLRVNYRLGRRFMQSRFRLLRIISRFMKNRQLVRFSSDISYEAVIGKNFEISHPIGIVIGKRVVIGDNVKLWHRVTLGTHKRSGAPHADPVIKNGVKIMTGATVIGGITVGNNAVIGAHSLVNIDIPDNCTAVGIPCRIISPRNGIKSGLGNR